MMFVFSWSSANVGFWFGSVSLSMELERYFCGGHLLPVHIKCTIISTS